MRFVDAHVGPGTAHEVDRRVRLRHALGQGQDRGVPVRRLLPRGVVDRQPGVVAQLGAGSAMRLIFVDARRPLAGDVDLLSERGARDQYRQYRPGSGRSSWSRLPKGSATRTRGLILHFVPHEGHDSFVFVGRRGYDGTST